MAFLEVKNYRKRFGGNEVLKGISFSLEKGEVLAIIGSSGGGKTTLLRCLNFLEVPDEGELYLGGEKLFDAGEELKSSGAGIREKRLHFGLVFQQFNLFPQYTVFKNVSLAQSLLAKQSFARKKADFARDLREAAKSERQRLQERQKAEIAGLVAERKREDKAARSEYLAALRAMRSEHAAALRAARKAAFGAQASSGPQGADKAKQEKILAGLKESQKKERADFSAKFRQEREAALAAHREALHRKRAEHAAALEKASDVPSLSSEQIQARKAEQKVVLAEIRANQKARIEEKTESLLARVGLSEKRDSYPYELSGGQQQRVAIARALALNPDILCFDEPTSALDPELTGEVLKVIKGLKSSDSTMIVVTHEMEFARNVADHVIFMADGVIEEEGTPSEVFDHPKSEKTASFLRKSTEDLF